MVPGNGTQGNGQKHAQKVPPDLRKNFTVQWASTGSGCPGTPQLDAVLCRSLWDDPAWAGRGRIRGGPTVIPSWPDPFCDVPSRASPKAFCSLPSAVSALDTAVSISRRPVLQPVTAVKTCQQIPTLHPSSLEIGIYLPLLHNAVSDLGWGEPSPSPLVMCTQRVRNPSCTAAVCLRTAQLWEGSHTAASSVLLTLLLPEARISLPEMTFHQCQGTHCSTRLKHWIHKGPILSVTNSYINPRLWSRRVQCGGQRVKVTQNALHQSVISTQQFLRVLEELNNLHASLQNKWSLGKNACWHYELHEFLNRISLKQKWIKQHGN